MLSYKYYLNTVTRKFTKHKDIVMSCSHINITLSESHVPTANRELQSSHVIIYLFLNTATRTVSKHKSTVLSYYHIQFTLTQSHLPSVNTKPQSCHVKYKY